MITGMQTLTEGTVITVEMYHITSVAKNLYDGSQENKGIRADALKQMGRYSRAVDSSV